MFETPGPRLFALTPGVDFAREVVDGLEARLGTGDPADWAKVTLFVNTRRMQRRIREVFDGDPPRLLPRIRLITDLALDPIGADLPPPVSPLRRRLELSQLVAQLLDSQPDLAPRSALFDLSDSLATLFDEMAGEGVTGEAIAALDVTDLSGHWSRALQFLQIARQLADETADREHRQRQVILRLTEKWQNEPPQAPMIVAGSTGSRGATALLLQAVAKLPQGAVILPGFDFDLPAPAWDRLDDALTGEDHPQFRFRRLMDNLGIGRGDVRHWTGSLPPSPARNRLVSLSLRPAPVTDQWRVDGAALGDLIAATEGLTLVESPSPRVEAEIIALRLRTAIDEGITAALITPDRMLTRQVAAALDRWRIIPDDSAGMPLPLSPPGRFLRQVAALAGERLTAEALLSLLKHPLCHSGREDRGDHLLRTRELELSIRRKGPPFPTGADVIRWAEQSGGTEAGWLNWATWIASWTDALVGAGTRSLSDHLTAHIALSERIAGGPDAAIGAGALWAEAAGRSARAICDDLVRHADAGGVLSTRDYAALFGSVLNGGEVRDRDKGHPQVLIWGTLEARVQGADLIILGGMNEGTWPKSPSPDPWLNRVLRQKAGLLLPERQIGLSAHDYSQAIAAREVWITRSIRSADAQTVASRWINRLTNLLGGLPEQGGDRALSLMRQRGTVWIGKALALSAAQTVVEPAPRPSPRPPGAARPKSLSVTAIGRLIRDPYSIYAEKVLRLSPLDPLTPLADAPLRGTILHRVFEKFIRSGIDPSHPAARDRLVDVATRVLAAECPWPTVRHLWLARLDRIAGWFVETEVERRRLATPHHYEIKGAATISDLEFTLTAKADRIDISPDGRAMIYDYKTGAPPSDKEQRAFEKQLLLEAAMVERGGFPGIPAQPVLGARFIGVGTKPVEVPAPLTDIPAVQVWTELRDLISRWRDPLRGYSSRMAIKRNGLAGSYDHLARFGEWDQSTPVTPEDIT
ncbi:MAG: double-strand break repair protein AddB [Rhodobacterales bacterium]|nr:double-strand break repair protein AddB [Rhodobacterales bacterium]